MPGPCFENESYYLLVSNWFVKIFVTVGAQMPFDRLVIAVDEWLESKTGVEAFAQVGPGGYRPKNMASVEFIEPSEYRIRVSQSSLLISHAGMGSIITALQYGKPIVVIPRKSSLLETRNDHQTATVEKFRLVDGIYVASDESDISKVLDTVSDTPLVNPISQFASSQLINKIRSFIEN